MIKLIVLFGFCNMLLLAFVSCGNDAPQQKITKNIDSLVKMYPDSVPVLINHGQFYYKKYLYSKAMPSAARAFRLDSNNWEARLLYANILNNRPNRTIKEVMAARRHFRVVLKKKSKNPEALVSLASTFSLTQDFEKSFQYLNEALRINPKYRDAYVLKGSNYLQLNKPDFAKSSYETAVQQDPAFYEGYLFLGSLYQQENNPICIEYYTTAANIRPNDLEILYAQAYAYQIFEKLNEAEIIYRKMRKLDKEYPMPVFQLAHIKQFNRNELDSAEILYNEAILIEPRFVEAWHNLGLLHETRGEKSRALQAYARALKYNPEFKLSREAADKLR